MKCRANNMVVKKLINGNTEISLEITDKENRLISQINAHRELLSSELEVVIDKYRKRRSLGHNRLFWDMCNYLADHINDPLITADDIYKDLISRYGVSTIYPVPDEILKMTIDAWESRGDGWLTQIQRKSKLEGDFTNVKFWFGSSIYDSKQFWKLVEGLKAKCREWNLDISVYDQQMQASLTALEEQEKIYEEKLKKEEEQSGNYKR